MFWVKDRLCSFTFFKALCLLVCLLFIASCGDDSCYTDITISSNGETYTKKTKNMDIDVKSDGKDTGVIITAGKTATISVGGVVSMCNNSVSDTLTYATKCDGGVKTICKDKCTTPECAASCTPQTEIPSTAELCPSKGCSVCINGEKSVRECAEGASGCTAPTTCSETGQYTYAEDSSGCTEPVTCTDDGDEQYTYWDGSATQTISIGTCTPITHIEDMSSLTNSNLLSVCDATGAKHVCPKNINQNNFRMLNWEGPCLTPSSIVGRGSQICKKNNLFCDSNNQGYTISLIGGIYVISSESYGDCRPKQGYQKLECDQNGNETVVFTDQAGNILTTPKSTGRTCIPIDYLSSYTVSVNSQQNQWMEIGSSIYAGDILTFSISAPVDGAPNALSNNSSYSYSTSNAINRFAPSKTRYAGYCSSAGCSNCPSTLNYDKSLSDYQSEYPKCAAISQMISDSYKMQDYAGKDFNSQKDLWSTFGKSLILQGEENGDCSASSSQCSGTYFNSVTNDIHSDFGVLTNVEDQNGSNQLSYREFIPKQGFSKICSKVCDTDYTDNIGGYTLKVTRKSCVAINGNPSPCCSDGRGALEYKWGSSESWAQISSDQSKYVDDPSSSSSESFTITNPSTTENLKLYLRVKSASDMRSYSLGSYSIAIAYKEYIGTSENTISGIIEQIKNLMRDMIFGDPTSDDSSPMIRYFNNLLGDYNYLQYIRVLLVLSVVLYGLTFLTGHTEISQKDLILWVLKIGVVVTLISPGSYNFLYDNMFQLFIDGSDELIKNANFIDSTPGPNTFSFVDNTLAILLFNGPTWLKILSLLMSSPIGIILVILLLISILYFLVGVMTAIVSYLMCLLAVGILILLAPIFIPFILFTRTNYLFQNWLKLLSRYAFEPALLIIGLQVLVAMFYAVFIKLVDFAVCWKCMLPINLGAVSSIKSFLDGISVTTEVFCISFFGPFGVYASGGSLFSGLGITFPSVILLTIIASLIKNYNSFISSMLDNFMMGRSALMSTRDAKGNRVGVEAGAFVRSKLGIDKLEKGAGKMLRKGVKAATGFEVQTKEDHDKEQKKIAETEKREGLRKIAEKGFLGRILGTDKDKDKFNDTVDNLSKSDDASNLHKDGKIDAKAASNLGSAMFKTLSNDQNAYESFVNGMTSLRAMKAKDVAKLDRKAPGIRDLHRVLNSSAVKGSFDDLRKPFDDLSDKDKKMRENAMDRVGKSIFMNKSASEALLNANKREALSKEIFKLARAPRSGIK